MFYVCAHDTTLHAAVAFCTALVRLDGPGRELRLRSVFTRRATSLQTARSRLFFASHLLHILPASWCVMLSEGSRLWCYDV